MDVLFGSCALTKSKRLTSGESSWGLSVIRKPTRWPLHMLWLPGLFG